IIYHGFKCGVSDVATLCLTLEQSFMSCKAICDLEEDIHGAIHSTANADQVQQIVGWHVRLWSRVLKRLAETPEPGTGDSMLDHTAAVLLFEGGY
ncbi:MAG: hypothetical protein ABEN55_09995, partial [Bradymonadaceae bacterium]